MESQNTVPRDDSAEQFIKLGQKLKSIREAQKLEIGEISQQTKIQKHYLNAIEEGRENRLSMEKPAGGSDSHSMLA